MTAAPPDPDEGSPEPDATNPSHELQAALRTLGQQVAVGLAPTRLEARAVLIPLGTLVLEGETDALVPAVEQLGALIGPFAKEWAAAVEQELALATEEYCRSVDPRFLDHPRYDLAYTEHSRELLEYRLRGAEALGMALGGPRQERIAASDATLEAHLDRPAQAGES